jgi:hypothetical protein
MKKLKKNRADWMPNMEQRADLGARQVRCLIASSGHLWMRGYFDRLPPIVRRRLGESAYNICPACLVLEAQRATSKPRAADFFSLIEAIEEKLGATEDLEPGWRQ